MENVILWIDDIRNPEDEQWKRYIHDTFDSDADVVWIKSYKEFVAYLHQYRPLPMYISFDHDLGLEEDGTEENGYDCAKFLVELMMDFKVHTMPVINVHSGNPVGKQNILALFDNYRKHCVDVD